MLTVKIDASAAIARLKDLQLRQLPFAMARALTWMAQDIAKEERRAMTQVFDRPTPGTLDSLYVLPATKQNLRAEVGIKQDRAKGVSAAKYLAPEIFGGPRRQKRSELSVSFKVGGRTIYMVPASGMKLDAYGNVPKGTMTKILSGLKASLDPYQNRTARSARRGTTAQYFIGSPAAGRLPLGIYERRDRRIVPLFIFVRQPQYRVRLPFFDIALKRVQEQGQRIFALSLADAIATAR
jgi:hypothetical protein